MGAILYSLTYAFKQKKRIHSNKVSTKKGFRHHASSHESGLGLNNRNTSPSFIDDDGVSDISEGDIVTGEVKGDNEYDALLRYWEEGGRIGTGKE